MADETSKEEGATSTSWAGGALLIAALLATVAKIAGVAIAPALHGAAPQATIDLVDTVTAALAYTLTGLLVALLCAGAFELARARRVGVLPRAGIVGLSGLVVALASPAVVARLHPVAALSLAVVTSLVALMGGIVAVRGAHTRAVGTVLALLAGAGLVRPFAWEAASFGGEGANMSLYETGVVLASTAVIVQAFATLLAATWLATRSAWRGRLATNLAVIAAFGVTYYAGRTVDGTPGPFEAGLRAAFGHTGGVPLPGALASVSAFLLPCSMLLAAVALIQKVQPAAVLAALSLALVSHGAFDVPLQALAALVSAQWLALAMADERGMWSTLVRDHAEKVDAGETAPAPPDPAV